VKEGAAGQKFNYQDPKTGDTHISYQNSTYPEWFGRQRGKTPWQGKWTRKEFTRLLDKLKTGQELNETEKERAEELYRAAQWTAENDHELTTGAYVDQLETKGFEPVFESRPAVDLNQGDKIIVGPGSEVPRDEYVVKGVDQAGNVILKDGVTQRIDGFDLLNIDGIKRSGKSGFGKPLKDEAPPSGGEAALSSLATTPPERGGIDSRGGTENVDAGGGQGKTDQKVQPGAPGRQRPDPGGDGSGGGVAAPGEEGRKIERRRPKAEPRGVTVKAERNKPLARILDRRAMLDRDLEGIDPEARMRIVSRVEDKLLGDYGVTDFADIAAFAGELDELGVPYVVERADGGNMGGANAAHNGDHAAADQDIRKIWGEIYVKEIREAGGVIARDQGDEFIAIWPNYTVAEVEKIRGDIEKRLRAGRD
ncbi:MAG: hypothetical protein ABR605_10755, partial [Desulfurivibrionaceae bacterium]